MGKGSKERKRGLASRTTENQRKSNKNRLLGIGVALLLTAIIGYFFLGQQTSWSDLSAPERLKRLRFHDYPQGQVNFDARAELVKATADNVCSQIPCRIPPEQLSSRVQHLQPQQFILAYEQDQKRDLSPLEEQQILTTHLENVTKEGRTVIFNDRLLTQLSNSYKRDEKLKRELPGQDIATVVEFSLLTHAFTHIEAANTPWTFDGFSARVPGEQGPVNFTSAEGFILSGTDQDGKPKYILGLNEAGTENVARNIAQAGGGYLSLGDNYANGADLIDILNRQSKITPKRFAQCYTGTDNCTPRDVIGLWGNRIKFLGDTPLKRGLLLSSFVGLALDGRIPITEAQKTVSDALK